MRKSSRSIILTGFLLILMNAFIIHAETMTVESVSKTLVPYLYGKIQPEPIDDRFSEINKIKKFVDFGLTQNPTDPQLLYLKGAYIKAYVSLYYYKMRTEKHATEEYMKEYKVRYNKLHNEQHAAWRQAIALDTSKEGALSSEMYSVLMNMAGSDVAIPATRRYLEREGEHMEDFTIFDIRGGVASSLAQMGRLDEALNEMEKLRQEFPQYSDKIDFQKEYMKKMAAKALKEIAATEKNNINNAKAPSTESQKGLTNEPNDIEKSAQEGTQSTITNKIPNKEIILLFIIIGFIVLAIIIWLRLKKKER